MRTRIRLGISICIAVAASQGAAFAQGAVTVIGGGLAQACYEAVEDEETATQQALALCDRAITEETLRRKDRAATYTNRGILYMRNGNNTRAMWDYQRSIDIMPELKQAKVNLGAALYNLKRYPEALQALNEGVATTSDEARMIGYYNRGLTHEALGDLQSAYEDFRSALTIKPDFKLATDQISRFTVVPADS
ncbi:MAG: tetratricopeptide repeat protein [Hyphomonadaceae bacterium]